MYAVFSVDLAFSIDYEMCFDKVLAFHAGGFKVATPELEARSSELSRVGAGSRM